MRSIWAVLAFSAVLGGCVVRQDPQEEQRAKYAKANEEREAYRQKQAEESKKRAEERKAARDAQDADRAEKKAQEKATADSRKQTAMTSSCDETRAARLEEIDRRMKSLVHKSELLAWQDEHCQIIDRSKPVVRVSQDSTGEYHFREGRDRGVDFECKGKPPPELELELEHQNAENIQVYKIPDGPRDAIASCRDADMANATSKEPAFYYWKQWCRERGANGKTSLVPAWCNQFKADNP